MGLLVVGYVAWVAVSFLNFQSRIYVPLPATPTVPAVVVAEPTRTPGGSIAYVPPTPTPDPLRTLPKGRFNVLVMGTDKRANDTEHWPRSDTLLLANVDTVSNTVRLMSIPRDLVVDVPGYGKNKVNAAYFLGEYYQVEGGGQALVVQTVSKFFSVPIDYYVSVNFEGFKALVDTVGGVYVDVPYAIDDYSYPSDDEGDPFGKLHVHFDEGRQYMDGKRALRYARTRHADNDFARSRRQLQIIMAMRQKATSLDLIPALPSLLDQLGGMVETNIPPDQQLGFIQLGYNMGPGSILTASIDSKLVSVYWLPDGGEGLQLNWKAAQPMLDNFFGYAAASSMQQGGGRAKATASPTPKKGTVAQSRSALTPGVTPAPPLTPTRKVAVTPLPTRKVVATPTPIRRRR